MKNTADPKPSAPLFDRSRLEVLPLEKREHDLDLGVIRALLPVPEETIPPALFRVAEKMILAREKGASIILMMGAHVLRSGVQRFLVDMIQSGFITCLAGNGAVLIHDYELAKIGATTESVARYIKDGRFGLWKETGAINEIINQAHASGDRDAGLAQSVGRAILKGDFPHKDISVLASAVSSGAAVTAHVGIGYDIIHQHPNCDGAATGALSYNDFLKFAAQVENLENGLVMNFGSAVMAPEVFLKALAMARNAARQKEKTIGGFSTLVCDLRALPEDLSREAEKTSPEYYFRPYKTMLVRSLEEGGESFYVRGPHAQTLPALWTALKKAEKTP